MRHTKVSLPFILSGLLGTSSAIADDANRLLSMEEVTVIGEKTERSLKDTTSSVSVISEAELNAMRYKSISDAVAEIANVVVLTGSVPDIRGVSGNGSAGGFNSISGGARARVTTLIDGVAEPFVADLTGDAGIWDLQQIEVYRGPQSTSNGRNSIGGAIFIKTKDPTFDWEAAVRAGYRNEDGYADLAGVLSGPIIEDTLAFRVSLQRLDADTITDEDGFATNPAFYDLNGLENDRAKAKLLWQPNDKFNALLSYATNHEQGDSGRIYYSGPDFDNRRKAFYRDVNHESDTVSLAMGYEINDNLSVDVLLAAMDYDWGFDSYEANAARQQQLSFEEENTTAEIKLNYRSNDDVLTGFVGLAYFDREQDIESLGAFLYGGDDDSNSEALFGELTYAVTDAFNIILGLRVQKEDQKRNFVFGFASVLDQDETISLPKLVLQYDLSDQTTIALSARKGYNAPGGALNFAAQEYYFYDEERVDTFEGSIRSTLLDGTLNLSTNVFLNNYEGYQALSSSRFITNMEDVQTFGVETEVVYRPYAALELTGALGLLHTDIQDAGVGYPLVDGNELNSAPKSTASLGLTYWFNDKFSAGFSLRYLGGHYGDLENTDSREIDSYYVGRLSANYSNENWQVAAFLNNAFDEDEFTVREPDGPRNPGGYVAVLDPRNLGVSVTYTF